MKLFTLLLFVSLTHAWGASIQNTFEAGAEAWQVYDYNGGAGTSNVFYPVTWEKNGGVNDSGYVWGSDERWQIDLPENPVSILPLIFYRRWVGLGRADLRDATVSVYLRGEKLDLKGGRCLFWVYSDAGATRWHFLASPLVIKNDTWGAKQTFRLTNSEQLWHRSWSYIPNQPGTLDRVLSNADSYGFSFVGFSGEVTGKIAMDELTIELP